MNKTKSFDIPKKLVFEAFKLIKANKGQAGIDDMSLEKFEENLKDNLYKIWNRMSSGTYFPPPVKERKTVVLESLVFQQYQIEQLKWQSN